MTNIDIQKICEIAKIAGEKILEIYNDSDFDIQTKSDESPVTKADLAANEIICKMLNSLYPNIPILSEESAEIDFSERKKWNELFIVDPLDGTKEFIKRNGQFTVNIAYVANNSPVEGVVYAPTLKTLYYTLNGESFIEVNDKSERLPLKNKRENYVVVASRSHQNQETKDYISKLKEKHPNLVVDSRGSSLKFCMLAEGSADEYPRYAPTSEWDTAAAHAVLKNLGLNIVDIETKLELTYNKENILNPYFWAGRL